MEAIPPEIILEILKRLPAKSLYRFKCVSKDWLSTISDPRFIDSHYDHSRSNPRLLFLGPCTVQRNSIHSFDDNPRRLLCSSHCSRSLGDRQLTATNHGLYFYSEHYVRVSRPVRGLICVDTREKVIRICNPSTREVLKLKTAWATAGHLVDDHSSTSSILFGYDPVEKKHKILNSWPSKEANLMVHYVFTLGENKWRNIKHDLVHRMLDSPSCCIDGVIYYVGNPGVLPAPDYFLMAFDVRFERFQRIHLPDGINFGILGKSLHECGGRLTLLGRGPLQSAMNEPVHVYGVAMWVLEDVHRSVWSLMRLFALPQNLCMRIMCEISTDRIHTGEILFAPRSFSRTFNVSEPLLLYYYNLEDASVRSIEVHGVPPSYIVMTVKVFRYVENIQSLRDLMRNSLKM